jgi:ATP-dependent Clp protease adaptor protein ClpS
MTEESMSQFAGGFGTETTQREDQKTKEPDMYSVVLLNDDYTTMDFVVRVLVEVFKKSPVQANAIMMKVHRNGKGVCGIYTQEVAETKISRVESMAREEGFPLKCSMEEV